MILGSLGTARAQTVRQLMVSRFVQALGASPGISVGAGVIGDIYKLEERGTPYGTYFGVSQSVVKLCEGWHLKIIRLGFSVLPFRQRFLVSLYLHRIL
jgi:MFS family permease